MISESNDEDFYDMSQYQNDMKMEMAKKMLNEMNISDIDDMFSTKSSETQNYSKYIFHFIYAIMIVSKFIYGVYILSSYYSLKLTSIAVFFYVYLYTFLWIISLLFIIILANIFIYFEKKDYLEFTEIILFSFLGIFYFVSVPYSLFALIKNIKIKNKHVLIYVIVNLANLFFFVLLLIGKRNKYINEEIKKARRASLEIGPRRRAFISQKDLKRFELEVKESQKISGLISSDENMIKKNQYFNKQKQAYLNDIRLTHVSKNSICSQSSIDLPPPSYETIEKRKSELLKREKEIILEEECGEKNFNDIKKKMIRKINTFKRGDKAITPSKKIKSRFKDDSDTVLRTQKRPNINSMSEEKEK